MDFLKILNRSNGLFDKDLKILDRQLIDIIESSKILVLGGAGSIGQSLSLEVFKRNPKTLHVVDISENNLVELVRNIRSSIGYGTGEFKTFALECGSMEFEVFAENQP